MPPLPRATIGGAFFGQNISDARGCSTEEVSTIAGISVCFRKKKKKIKMPEPWRFSSGCTFLFFFLISSRGQSGCWVGYRAPLVLVRRSLRKWSYYSSNEEPQKKAGAPLSC